MAASRNPLFEAVAASGGDRAQTLARLDALSKLLDTAFVIPGTKIRFGIDGIVGLAPGIGDLVGAVLSSYIIWEARRLGLPRWKIARMMANVGFQTVVGMVPFVGDAVDVMFRANRRNMRIVREHFADDWRRAAPWDTSQADGKVIDGDYTVAERRR